MIESFIFFYLSFFFFFNDTATTEIYTLSLHDALPISSTAIFLSQQSRQYFSSPRGSDTSFAPQSAQRDLATDFRGDRKSTRLNSSHTVISYAVFCLKKKKKKKKNEEIK